MGRQVPTLKDVAERAGVAIQTVSSILHDRPGYTAETRARVHAAIAELGYRPFSVAQSLRTRQTHTIALVVSDIANPYCATIASVAEDYAHRFGYSLVVYNTHDDAQRETGYLQTIMQRWIDGLVFMSAEDKMNSLGSLQTAGIPTVAIDRIPENYTGPSVILDNIKAGRIAAEHLLALGHTKLAHISGPLRLAPARERLTGFRQAVEASGLALGSCVGGEGNWACEFGYQAMQRLLNCQPWPTAVFAANDRMAIGAMRAIYEAGLRVPDDISVMGLDDIEVAAYQVPPLTTVRQSFSELATRAVQVLIEILRGQPPTEAQIVVEPLLIQRQSTASPGGRQR
jgi:LacI family transcriptional regulator